MVENKIEVEISSEYLKEVEETVAGKALLTDDELLYWLRKDVKVLIAEVRRLQAIQASQVKVVVKG